MYSFSRHFPKQDIDGHCVKYLPLFVLKALIELGICDKDIEDYHSIPVLSRAIKVSKMFWYPNTPPKDFDEVFQKLVVAIHDEIFGNIHSGLYPCKENAEALEYINKALSVLKHRTEDRILRQVEGTMAL